MWLQVSLNYLARFILLWGTLLLASLMLWAGYLYGQDVAEPQAAPKDRQPILTPSEGWVYGDPLDSTTPVNFHPRDRHDVRPTRTDEEYARVAGVLRAAYSKPPDQWPKAHIKDGVTYVELGPVQPASYPEDNPYSDAKAKLGELLFFDARLSGSGQMACASCHAAELGWADGRARSLGHGGLQLERNAQSLLNASRQAHLFWDGRVDSLEDQAMAVFLEDTEMRTTPAEMETKLRAIPGYAPLFKQAFGDGEITIGRVVQAIATHVRSIVSEPSSRFDRFLAGNHGQLNDSAIRGLHLFRTDANCLNCHSGPILSDGRFHNLGLTYFGRKYEDLGRYNVTKDPADVGRFRTPSLRNVARTAPYTHVGFFDLPGLINLYNAGGSNPRQREEFVGNPLWPTTDPLLEPLYLNEQDKADLTAFLESLTERRRRDLVPDLPR